MPKLTERIVLRLTPIQKMMIAAAADLEGVSMSEFVRRAALESALRVNVERKLAQQHNPALVAGRTVTHE